MSASPHTGKNWPEDRKTKSEIVKARLLNGLTKSRGIVTDACKIAGISTATYYKYYKNDPEFAEAAMLIQESNLDFVESKLYELISEKNISAVLFYLKCKGRGRGYIEQNDTNVNVNDIQIDLNID